MDDDLTPVVRVIANIPRCWVDKYKQTRGFDKYENDEIVFAAIRAEYIRIMDAWKKSWLSK